MLLVVVLELIVGSLGPLSVTGCKYQLIRLVLLKQLLD